MVVLFCLVKLTLSVDCDTASNHSNCLQRQPEASMGTLGDTIAKQKAQHQTETNKGQERLLSLFLAAPADLTT